MNRYELKITNIKSKKSHTISSPSYPALLETFFSNSGNIYDSIVDTAPHTVYVHIGNNKYIATYFPKLGNLCILHSVVNCPAEMHDGAFDELDIDEFDKKSPGRSWYYIPTDDDIVDNIVSPYKLVVRDKTVAANTYDIGAICFYKRYTAVITAISNNIYGETRYSVYLVEKNMVFNNIDKEDLQPDKYNSIVRWVPNDD